MNLIHAIKKAMKLILQSLLMITLFSVRADAFTMKTGDVLLESIPCYLCGLIETEEASPYSHMGVVVLNHGVWNVLESLGNVRSTTLDEFLGLRKKDTHTLVLRINHDLEKNNLTSEILMNRFDLDFTGLSYDPQFLWNNHDSNGEKLYCSEFVAKFLQPFMSVTIPTKPMHFEVNRQLWINYFHGTPPDGLPGLSPGDFERSPLFHKVGVL
jgi:hypothetical protein